MKNNLKLLIIIGIAILVIIVFIFISLLDLGGGAPPPSIVLPTPTPEFVEGELYISQILPLDTSKTYNPAQPIEISFTQSVDKLAIKYEVSPQTNTFVTDSPNTKSLIIAPVTIWGMGSTSITILDDTVSTEGRRLKNPQTYILNVNIPTIPAMEGAY